MVSKLRIIWKQTVVGLGMQQVEQGQQPDQETKQKSAWVSSSIRRPTTPPFASGSSGGGHVLDGSADISGGGSGGGRTRSTASSDRGTDAINMRASKM